MPHTSVHRWYLGNGAKEPFSDARRSRYTLRLHRYRLVSGLVSIIAGLVLVGSVAPVNACNQGGSSPAPWQPDARVSLEAWLHRVGYFGTYIRILPDGRMSPDISSEVKP